MSASTTCDICGGLAVQRGDAWVHADPERAASVNGPHDPFKFPQETADYLNAVLRGGSR